MRQRQMPLHIVLTAGILLCNMFFFTPVSAALTFPIKYDPIIKDPSLIIDNPIIDNPPIIDDSLIREPLIIAPAAPSDLLIGATTSTEITIEWSDNSFNETGFSVERKTGGTSWRKVGSVDSDETNFTSSGLSPDTTYYFRVAAYNTAGTSGYSNQVYGTTDQPAPVTNIYEDNSETIINETDITNEANTNVNIIDSTINNSNIASNNQVNQTNTVANYNSASTAVEYVRIVVNGEQMNPGDAPPFINKNNRVMVPFRAIAEKLGATVQWDPEERIAALSQGQKLVRVPIGQQVIEVDGNVQAMDTLAVIKSSRTYIPVRAVSQALGATVEWDQANKTVIVKTDAVQ